MSTMGHTRPRQVKAERKEQEDFSSLRKEGEQRGHRKKKKVLPKQSSCGAEMGLRGEKREEILIQAL